MQAKRFFEVAFVELAKDKALLFANLKGRLSFIIRDIGAWTVHLGNVDAPVIKGAQEDADLVLSFTAEAFTEFSAGTLDLQKALAENQIAHDGDLKVLQHFSRLLQNPTSPLMARTQ